MQLSQKAAVPLRMSYTDSKRLFRRLKDEKEKNELSFRSEGAADRCKELTTEMDEFLLRSNDCKVSYENLEHNLLEQEVVVRTMTASRKHMIMRASLLESKIGLLHNINDKPMKEFCEQKNLVRKSVTKLAKHVPTRCLEWQCV